MKKLILYPIIAIIVVVINSLLLYYVPIAGYIMFGLLAAWILYRTVRAWINLFTEDLQGTNVITWRIPKGKHYARPFRFRPRFFFKKNIQIRRYIMISKPTLYLDDDCVNKLFGVTFGLNPLKNSIRFGFRRVSNVGIDIVGYSHLNGETIEGETEYSIPIDQWVRYDMYIGKYSALLYVNDFNIGEFTINRRFFGYLNRPYNGGDEPAYREYLIHEKKK